MDTYFFASTLVKVALDRVLLDLAAVLKADSGIGSGSKKSIVNAAFEAPPPLLAPGSVFNTCCMCVCVHVSVHVHVHVRVSIVCACILT